MEAPSLPDRFELLEPLIETDSAVLLRAMDCVLHREVVLKLPGRGLSRERDRDRLLREARMHGRVRHPGVTRLLDVLEVPGGPILVLEPVAGEQLARVLAGEGAFAPEVVLRLGIHLADALSAVHAAGVVHRGISTENILYQGDGRPVLTGFVFAKPGGMGLRTSVRYRVPDNLTEPPAPLPAHPAPEQVMGQAADARSDIFGLGCVLYRCLTGQEAFPRGTIFGWRDPEDPGRLVPKAPPGLLNAVRKCLAKSPMERFQSAQALKEALESVAAARTPARPEAGPIQRVSRGRKAIAIGPAAGVAAALVVLGVMLLRNVGPRSTRDVNQPGASRGRSISTSEPGGFQAAYQASRALLIGIGGAYGKTGFRVLPNAESDVKALRRQLESMAWENWSITALVGEEATYDHIRSAMSEIERHSEPDDRVFIYYAGHGDRHERAEKSGWIIPADAVSLDRDPSRRNWYRFDEFNKFFEECRAKHILVALDCCFSGIGVSITREAGAESYSRNFLTRKAHVLLASSRPDEPALDGPPEGHSPFAEVFLTALSKGGGGPLTTSELGLMIQKHFVERGISHYPVIGHHFDTAPDMSEVVFFRGGE